MRTLLALHRRRGQRRQIPHRLSPLRRRPRSHPLPALHRNPQHHGAASLMSSTNTSRYEYPPTEFDPKPRDKRGLVLAISALVVIIARITKHIVAQQLPNGQTYTLIPGIFRISDVHNTGPAFSMFASHPSPA